MTCLISNPKLHNYYYSDTFRAVLCLCLSLVCKSFWFIQSSFDQCHVLIIHSLEIVHECCSNKYGVSFVILTPLWSTCWTSPLKTSFHVFHPLAVISTNWKLFTICQCVKFKTAYWWLTPSRHLTNLCGTFVARMCAQPLLFTNS